jgi:hypothetical protein
LVYDLMLDTDRSCYQLTWYRTVYTLFRPALDRIITPEPGPVDEFMDVLQEKLDVKLDHGENPPDTPTLADLL